MLLGPGAYTWRLAGGTADGSPLGRVDFVFASQRLDDPLGPMLTDPTQPPIQPIPGATWRRRGASRFNLGARRSP